MAAAQLRINLRDLHAATQTAADCRGWMRHNGLLAVHMACPKCNGQMEESEYQRVTDRVTWRCKPKNCRTIASIRKGSFFESAHLPLSTLIDMVYYWSIEMPHATIQCELGVDDKTVTDWANFLREVCSQELVHNPVRLGGPGHTVAVDETLVAKRKPGNQQGRPVEPKWVFGAVDLGTGQFFMEMVDQRDAATLEPIIRNNILPGTRIWSDQWGAYNNLNNLGFIHETVNHSRHYVDPVTGVHTNNIEARWSACKASFKRRFGIAREMIPSYLDEHMWRVRHPRPETFEAIVAAIARQYPV